MTAIKWKVKSFLYKYGTIRRLAVLVAFTVLLYTGILFQTCSYFWLADILSWPRSTFVCMKFSGGLGNHMFQYAFAYSMAKDKNKELIIESDNKLIQTFDMRENPWELYGFNSRTCYCFWTQVASLDCGYDKKMLTLTQKDLSFDGYFQSWMYWIKYEKELRNVFKFKLDIKLLASDILNNILKVNDISTRDTVIVGIHIRRGDYKDPLFVKFGYNVVPAVYITNAINYFKQLFDKIFFIVCSNDYEWSHELLGTEKNFHIVQGNSASVDMALLSMTNHTIMTVGTYGWFISWLTGGKTVYYKYPYVKGSPFSRHFHKNYSDHFYPGWIGME